MARSGANTIGSLAGLGQVSELRKRLVFVLLALIVYRIGTYVPVPGIDPSAMARFFDQQSSTILGMFNMFSGGALQRLSILALGIMPYISASIIMQLMSAVVPSLKELKKEGEAGRRKITQYTRYGTVFLATFQAIGVSLALQNQQVALTSGFGFIFTATVSLVTGTMFLMWLGEQITERGIGNGISIIIFAGIVAGLPAAIGGTLDLVSQGALGEGFVLFLFLGAIVIIGFVVFVERAQRRITVNYARRQQGRKMMAAQSTHLPLKLNMSGVIPPIFASSIILFPSTLLQWSSSSTGGFSWMQNAAIAISPGQPLYVLLYALAIVFFCLCTGTFIPAIRAT